MAQEHFVDLCRMLGHPTPNDPGAGGNGFVFEKGAKKAGGGDGWADVWKRHFFGWEYKGKHKDLEKAYSQLLQYRDALENPPLLVVSDIETIVVRTNFTNTPTEVHVIRLEEIDLPKNVRVLKALFTDPTELTPQKTRDQITQEAVGEITLIATRKREHAIDDQVMARFLDRCVFCFFAEDVGLLPQGSFTDLLQSSALDPARFQRLARQYFEAMSKGGDYGSHSIRWFNGNLFDGSDVPLLGEHDLTLLTKAGRLYWKFIDPRIFGTLFQEVLERRAERAALGAHYTKEKDILALVNPVLIAPLRADFVDLQSDVHKRIGADRMGLIPQDPSWYRIEIDEEETRWMRSFFYDFQTKLQSIRILDPACGSGNFLYVALRSLLDLEKELVTYAARFGIDLAPLRVSPRQLWGIEKSPYAWQLAQLTVWIAYLQWRLENGFDVVDEPILQTQDTFLLHDAIVGDDGAPYPWPEAEIIIGNPPFLGGKRLREILGDSVVESIYTAWDGRVSRESDLCCYWFEMARAQIELGLSKRAGLLATQSVRGGANRDVLKKIKETGEIFFAVSDQVWYEVTGDAHVQISMVGFDGGEESGRVLDGKSVAEINADLSSGTDLTTATRLPTHVGLCFMGTTKGGAFEIDFEAPNGSLGLGNGTASAMVTAPNPHGKPNSDVLVPWVSGNDLTGRPRLKWIIDFGVERAKEDAALYELPFEYLLHHVYTPRQQSRSTIGEWWLQERTRGAMRSALGPLTRYIGTPTTSKHRLYQFFDAVVQPANSMFAFARADYFFFGVMHSRFHSVWSKAVGTQLRERESGFRYTPETCFDTFALPFGQRGLSPQVAHLSVFATAQEALGLDDEEAVAQWQLHQDPDTRALFPEEFGQVVSIARAAHELDQLRERWLNPPEYMETRTFDFPASVNGPWRRHIIKGSANSNGVGTARYEWKVARALKTEVANRTLTNLYNKMPTWLVQAHERLDNAVAKAYQISASGSDMEVLAHFRQLNQDMAIESGR